MDNLYKILGLSRSAPISEINEQLSSILRQARDDMLNAPEEDERKKAEETLIYARQALLVFKTDESKTEYDEALDVETDKQVKRVARENSKYEGPDESLDDLLVEAVKKEDYTEIQSLSREYQLRGCENATYYRYLADAFSKQDQIHEAWRMIELLKEKYPSDTENLSEALASFAENELGHDNTNELVRQAIDQALEYDDILRGKSQVVDINWDLKSGNEAMAIQKAKATAAKHPDWKYFRSVVSIDIFTYARKQFTEFVSDSKYYFTSKENYESYLRLIHLSADIVPQDNNELLSNLNKEIDYVEGLSAKQMIPGGWWAVVFPLTMGVAMLVQPILRLFSYILIAIAIIFFVGLRIPKYLMYKYHLEKKLDGGKETLRILSKPVGFFGKLLFWPVALMLKHKPEWPKIE